MVDVDKHFWWEYGGVKYMGLCCQWVGVVYEDTQVQHHIAVK